MDTPDMDSVPMRPTIRLSRRLTKVEMAFCSSSGRARAITVAWNSLLPMSFFINTLKNSGIPKGTPLFPLSIGFYRLWSW